MAVVVSFVGKWDGKDVERAQREIGKFSDQSSSRFGGFAKKAGVAFAAVGAAAGAAAVGVGVAAGKMAIQFDTAMTKIQSLVGLTADEVDGMKSSVLALSGQTAKSPEELADALFVVTSAGLRGKDAMDALEFSAKAGAAGLGETADIARSVAGALSAYGSDTLSAAAATDQIVATARAGNFETSQFAGALGRVLPFANQAGAGLDQVGGAVALLTRVNGDAAQSVTQMNALFKAFVTPTAEAQKALAGVGLSAEDVRDKIAADGLPAALDMLDEKLGGNREQLGKMLGSSEAASAAFQILDADSQTIADTFGAVSDAAGMTNEAFDITAESTGFKLQESFQTVKNSLLELGDSLTPLADLFAEKFSQVSEVIDKLQPVMEPLVSVLMEVGDVLANLLLDALDALIPAVLPIVKIFGDLVRRIGPLLSKILGKVADVLVKVLDAVVPLLGPLMDLVFGILDAAWPIIETVIDVFLILVDAITPLLDAVMALLTPLGELIEVGLKAIMPVIKPLLPVIEALAVVLGDVLVRAIGFIMAGLGGLIIAFSKLYPFILRNVTKPILDEFLKFAEDLVGAAATAFGWIPGLGDKLDTAKEAIGTFRQNAVSALDGAADEIAEEGEKIGKGLIDQGVEAMTDPAALSRTRKAGKTAGFALADGMRIGIQNGQIPVQAASRDLVYTADAAARKAGEIRSPSKLFEKIGSALSEGLEKGLKDRKQKVADQARQTVQAAIEAAQSAVQEFEDYRDSVKESLVGLLDLGQAYDDYVARQKAVSDTLAELTKYQSQIQGEATDDQKTKLKELQGAYQEAQTAAAEGAGSIVEEFIQQGERIRDFNANLQKLLAAGLSKRAFDAIRGMTLERGSELASALIDGNIAENARRVSEVYDQVGEMGYQTGQQASSEFLASGVLLATKTLEGIIREFLPAGRKRRELLQAVKSLNDSIKFEPKYIDIVTRRYEVGQPPPTVSGQAAVAASLPGGPAANADVASQFSQAVLDNAARLNAAAAAGQDVTRLGFTAADWSNLAALEAANIAALATGGIVLGPTLALIGEAGPEAVIPLSGRNAPTGMTMNVTVNAGIGTDGAEVGRQIVDALKSYERRNGRVYASA